jgi:carboxylesterase
MVQVHSVNLTAGDDVVLLLHGLAGSPLEMRYLANALHQQGLSVEVPHIPGYGYGEPASHWRDWHDRTVGIFDRLKRDYRSVSVGGLCIGAVLALTLAAEKGLEVSALSLLSTTLFYDGWGLPWYSFMMPLGFFTPLRTLYSYREREPFGIKNPRLRERVANAMRGGFSEAGAARLSMNHLHQATRLIRHATRSMHAVTAPALVMHAVEDETASPKSADFVVDRIGSTTIRKVFLDNSYHMITIDNDRELVARETRDFFLQNIDEGAGPRRQAIPAI